MYKVPWVLYHIILNKFTESPLYINRHKAQTSGNQSFSHRSVKFIRIFVVVCEILRLYGLYDQQPATLHPLVYRVIVSK